MYQLRKRKSPALERSRLSKAAGYDDLLTDLLLDRLSALISHKRPRWNDIIIARQLNTQKITVKYVPIKGIPTEEILKSISSEVSVAENLNAFLDLVTKRPEEVRFDTVHEMKWFAEQFARYRGLYQPNCFFQLATKEGYGTGRPETAVFALRPIKKNTCIRYLEGVCVPVERAETRILEATGKDFSMIKRGRNGIRSLLMGPARFVNHDCNPNAILEHYGRRGVCITTLKSIKKGEEITVYYRPDYFGYQNQNCRCTSCKLVRRNGWK